MGNNKQNEESVADPITMMLAMKKELESLKQKNKVKGPTSRERDDEKESRTQTHPDRLRELKNP